MSDVTKTINIVHTSISAIAIAANVVCSALSAVPTLGASFAFTAMGAGITLFGCGVSTSSMICQSTENAVIVSQCINGGDVVTPDSHNLYRVGGVVGHLMDYGQVYDCLNTAGVRGGHLVGTAEKRSSIRRCMSIWKNSSNVSNTANLFYRTYGAKYDDLLILDDDTYMPGDGCGSICMEDMKKTESYPWPIGASENWHIPEGADFAIPYKSEMHN